MKNIIQSFFIIFCLSLFTPLLTNAQETMEIKGVFMGINESKQKIRCWGPFGTCIIATITDNINPDPPDKGAAPTPPPEIINGVVHLTCNRIEVVESGDETWIYWY